MPIESGMPIDRRMSFEALRHYGLLFFALLFAFVVGMISLS